MTYQNIWTSPFCVALSQRPRVCFLLGLRGTFHKHHSHVSPGGSATSTSSLYQTAGSECRQWVSFYFRRITCIFIIVGARGSNQHLQIHFCISAPVTHHSWVARENVALETCPRYLLMNIEESNSKPLYLVLCPTKWSTSSYIENMTSLHWWGIVAMLKLFYPYITKTLVFQAEIIFIQKTMHQWKWNAGRRRYWIVIGEYISISVSQSVVFFSLYICVIGL